ncbi:MAG TPA: immunoglobulin domain-containing protein, partial [Verrucomicrobiae bacterium]
MYGHYLYQYNLPGNITVTTRNLPAGTYDFYYYAGCGDYNYNLTVNGVSQGQKSVFGSGSSSTNWQEGVHYVVFRGVTLADSVSTVQVVITYIDSVCLGAVISGMQIAESFAVPTAPFFVSQPTNQTIASGYTANFQAGAIGSPPPVCQWFFNNVPLANDAHIAGAGTFSLSVSNAQPADAGDYFLLVSNSLGSATSQVATLSVQLLPPVFSVQPSNRIVSPSSNFVCSAPATGSIPINYQWFFNGVLLTDGGNISGATTATLALNGAQTNQSGTYFVVASNNISTATSSIATLFVGVPPVITQQPASATNFAGTLASLSVLADGTAPLAYQWLLNNTPLVDDTNRSGSQTATLIISNAQSADAGNYTVTITNGAGAVTSAVATLTVWLPPAITVQPIGRSVPPGLPTVFSAAASSTPFSATYQWQLNGTNIPDATNTTYSIPAVSTNDLGIYHFIASNIVGATVSVDAKLTFGNVAAWGRNSSNESLPPPDLTNAFAVAGGASISFAARPDGSVVSWGAAGLTNIPPTATNVVGLASGGGTVLLRNDGSITGWGFGAGANFPVPAATNIVAVAAGYNFGLALRAEGSLISWGGIPVTNIPAGLNHVTAIACGSSHALAVKDDGTVAAWGDNRIVQPSVPANLTGVVGVAAGFSHSLALKADGTVVAWGSGSGVNVPAGLTNVAAIFCGSYPQGQSVSLAVRSNGTVVAWGDGFYGETNPPPALTNLYSVSGGGAAYHAMAIVNDGSPNILRPPVGLTAYVGRDVTLHATAVGAAPLNFQWLFNGLKIAGATNSCLVISNVQPGAAGNYQLIVSNAQNIAVSLPAPLTVISNSALALLTQPGVTNFYQGSRAAMGIAVLGNGPLQYQWYFSRTNIGYVRLSGATNDTLILDPALAAQSGNYYVAVSNQCAGITSTPANVRVLFARAWGFQAVSNPPVTMTNAIAIAAGNSGNYWGSYFAVGSDGKVVSWANYTPSYGETYVSGLSNSFVTAIAAGMQDTLALKADGTLVAWGYNNNGQTNVPAGLNGVTAIACGDYHMLALKSDGSVVAWGSGAYGQTNIPASVTNVVAIAAGSSHCLAVRADGTVVGWGNNNSGQTTVPPTATNIIAIAGGSAHGVALRANGTVVQWGNGIANYPIPSNLSNAVAISASGTHCTALRADGSVCSWGYEYVGFASNNVPVDVANVVALASSSDHDFALLGTRAPTFTIQPLNRSVFVGTPNVMLAGKVAGLQPMSYQWLFNGTNIPGATNDNFRLTNVQFAQAGAYQLIASNAAGVTVSKVVKLSVSVPLGVALDATRFNWTSSGAVPWFGQTNISQDGLSAARSGSIGNSQESILQTTVAANWSGRCTFWWKVSSEAFFDTLEFRLNGVVQDSISGEQDWQLVSIPVAAGTNVLQWRYFKDSSNSAGQDAAWVDQFAFIPDPPVISQQPAPASQVVNWGSNVTYTVSANGGPLGYQWLQNGTNPVGNNSSVLQLANVGRAQNGTYYVTVTNAGGSVTSSNVILNVRVPQLLTAPKLASDGTLTLSSTDADGGLLTDADLANLQAQVSTNLLDWTTLTNALTLTNGVVQLQDPGATNSPNRYYRILEY